ELVVLTGASPAPATHRRSGAGRPCPRPERRTGRVRLGSRPRSRRRAPPTARPLRTGECRGRGHCATPSPHRGRAGCRHGCARGRAGLARTPPRGATPSARARSCHSLLTLPGGRSGLITVLGGVGVRGLAHPAALL